MDPNEALKRVRELAASVQRLIDKDSSDLGALDDLHSDAGDLVAHFQALDTWLVGGGFLPVAWENGRRGD